MSATDSANRRDLHFACFSDTARWGGAGTAARGLIAASTALGLRTLLVDVSTRGDGTCAPRPGAAHWTVRVTPPPILWRVQSWRVCRQLEHYLRRVVPPRVAFIALHAYWAVAARRAWPAARVVYFFPCLLSNCLPFTWARCRPTLWKRLDFAGIRRAEHLAFDAADQILVPTETAREEVVAFHPAAAGRVAVCAYGAAPQPFGSAQRAQQRQVLGLAPDDFVCLAAGVFDTNKDFAWAIQELARSDPRVRLLLVGDGPQRQPLARLASELAVAARVVLPGPQREMAPWYAAADCLVSTSRYDTFPNVVLEAMCHGRPVLVPRHDPPHVYSGTAEIVAREGGGRVYDRRQAGVLATCWNEWAADRRQVESLGAQARDLAARRFRWDVCLDTILGGTAPRGGGPTATAELLEVPC